MIKEEKLLIVNALKVIRETCISFQGLDTDIVDFQRCMECPLGYERGGCQLTESYPFKYDINDPDDTWRALK